MLSVLIQKVVIKTATEIKTNDKIIEIIIIQSLST